MDDKIENKTKKISKNPNKKYFIYHENTNNKELGVTLHKTISSILDIPITEINLDKHLDIEALNHIYKDLNQNQPPTSKITLQIKNLNIEIYNNKQIIITPKNKDTKKPIS